MANPLTFLIADDEESISMALQMLIAREFKDAIIHTAADGKEAWRIAQNCLPDMILSDLSMPEMNGLELCSHVKSHSRLRETYFIILTAHLGNNQKDEALRSGADDFLHKPFSADELLLKIRNAISVLKESQNISTPTLGKTRNEVLKRANPTAALQVDTPDKTIADCIRLVSAILRARLPEMDEALEHASRIAGWIAQNTDGLSEREVNETTAAARICLIGKMFLNDGLLKADVTKDGLAAHEIMSQVPIMAQQIMSSVQELESIGYILRHIFENLDGSGFPDRLQAWQIPIQSRIVRVVHDYIMLCNLYPGSPNAEIMTKLQRDAKRLYEQKILVLLQEYMYSQASSSTADRKAVHLQELEEGMMLTADIITNSGLKLLPSGATLTAGSINKIISHTSSDPIIGTIYVKK